MEGIKRGLVCAPELPRATGPAARARMLPPMAHSLSASPRVPPGLGRPHTHRGAESEAGAGEHSPLQDRLPREYDHLCVQPWKDKAEQTLRLHDRKFSAFSRTALSLENVSALPSGRRPKGEHPAGAAVPVLVSPQIKRMEEDLLEYRRDIEMAFKTALVSQMREIELNCRLKDTLCYACWVNLRLVLSDAADDFQADPQQMRKLRDLLDKYEVRSEQLRTRSAFEAAALQIQQLQKLLGLAHKNCSHLQEQVKQLQQQVLEAQAKVEHERQLRASESESVFQRLGELGEQLREARVLNGRSVQPSHDDVIQHIFDQLDVENRGGLSIDELKEALISLMPEPVSPDDYRLLTEAFARFDPENTGLLDIEQLKQVFSDPTLSFFAERADQDETGRLIRGISRLSSGGSRGSRRTGSVSSRSSTDGGPSDEVAELRAQVEQYRKDKSEWEKTRKGLESKLNAARLEAKEPRTKGVEEARAEAEASPRTSPRSNMLARKMTQGVSQAQDKNRKKQADQVVSTMAKKKSHTMVSKVRQILPLTGGKPNFIKRVNEASLGRTESEGSDFFDEMDEYDDDTGVKGDSSDVIRRRNQRYHELGAVLAVFGVPFHFHMVFNRYYGRRSDVLLKMMENEFNDFRPERIITSNHGHIETTLRIEWDFVLNPHNHRRLLADCDKFDWPKEWPNSKGINAFTERANVLRKPLPLEHFLEHKMAKLAGLNKTEVAALRLWTGPAYCAINSSLRAMSSSIPSFTCDDSGQISKMLPKHAFTVTSFVLNSGLSKLAKVTALSSDSRGVKRLYRGLSKLSLDSKLLISADAHRRESLQLMVLLRFSQRLDAATLHVALHDTPGALSGQGEDGHFTHEQVQEVRACLQNVLQAQPGKLNPIVEQPEAKKHPKYLKRTDSATRTLSQSDSTCSRTASTSSQFAAEITVHVIQDPLAIDAPSNAGLFLSSFADMKSVVLALQHIMDEQQVRALVCHGLSQMQEERLSEDELFTLRTYEEARHHGSFVELAFSSATTDLLVALEYATADKYSTILEIEVDGVDKVAAIAWLSQFPDEDEHTIPALSNFHITNLRRMSKKELEVEAKFHSKESKIRQRILELELRIALHHVPTCSAEDTLHDTSQPHDDQEDVAREPTALEVLEQELSDQQLLLDQLREDRRVITPRRSRFNDYVNVLTVKANVNGKVATSEELCNQRKQFILDFGMKLMLEADTDPCCGPKIAKLVGEKMAEYREVNAAWFDQVINFHSVIHHLMDVCEQTVRRAKMESSTALKLFMEGSETGEVNEDEFFDEAAKLMRMCEASNEKDAAEMWPQVKESFVRVAEIKQRDGGADAVLHTIIDLNDRALHDNVPSEGIQEVMAHVLSKALETQPVIELMFSNDEWDKLQDVMAGRTRREPTEDDLEAILQYMDDHYKKATATQLRGYQIIKRMIDQALESENRDALAAIRSKLGSCGAIPIVVKAVSAVHDNVKGFEKPTPWHPVEMIQKGCRVLELMTSEREVHEGNVGLCQKDTKIAKRLFQVLDQHIGDEIVIEAILHLFIHYDFECLDATCRQTPYNLQKLLKEAAQSVKRNDQKHQTISKQVRTLVERAGGNYKD